MDKVEFLKTHARNYKVSFFFQIFEEIHLSLFSYHTAMQPVKIDTNNRCFMYPVLVFNAFNFNKNKMTALVYHAAELAASIGTPLEIPSRNNSCYHH